MVHCNGAIEKVVPIILKKELNKKIDFTDWQHQFFKNLARTIASIPMNIEMLAIDCQNLLIDTQEWHLLCVVARKQCTQFSDIKYWNV